MSNLTREQLRTALGQDRIGPLYLLFGPEDYLRDRAARAITEHVLRDAPLREFNESIFSLTDPNTGVREAIAAAEQMPMMTTRRVVRINDINKLTEDDESALLSYVERPAETCVVILTATDMDRRRKVTKTLINACASVEFLHLKDSDLKPWLHGRLRDLEATIDNKTFDHIITLVGSDARRLSNELAKLATAALPTGKITMKLVDDLVGRSRDQYAFDLSDELIARDARSALRTLKRLFDDRAEPVMLIGILASTYHKLAIAKELMARGAPDEDLFRLAPFDRTKRSAFFATARRSEADSLARSIKLIADADLAIKTSRGTPRMQLEILVCELASS
jgi:DNA polymerase III subunit delta